MKNLIFDFQILIKFSLDQILQTAIFVIKGNKSIYFQNFITSLIFVQKKILSINKLKLR